MDEKAINEAFEQLWQGTAFKEIRDTKLIDSSQHVQLPGDTKIGSGTVQLMPPPPPKVRNRPHLPYQLLTPAATPVFPPEDVPSKQHSNKVAQTSNYVWQQPGSSQFMTQPSKAILGDYQHSQSLRPSAHKNLPSQKLPNLTPQPPQTLYIAKTINLTDWFILRSVTPTGELQIIVCGYELNYKSHDLQLLQFFVLHRVSDNVLVGHRDDQNVKIQLVGMLVQKECRGFPETVDDFFLSGFPSLWEFILNNADDDQAIQSLLQEEKSSAIGSDSLQLRPSPYSSEPMEDVKPIVSPQKSTNDSQKHRISEQWEKGTSHKNKKHKKVDEAREIVKAKEKAKDTQRPSEKVKTRDKEAANRSDKAKGKPEEANGPKHHDATKEKDSDMNKARDKNEARVKYKGRDKTEAREKEKGKEKSKEKERARSRSDYPVYDEAKEANNSKAIQESYSRRENKTRRRKLLNAPSCDQQTLLSADPNSDANDATKRVDSREAVKSRKSEPTVNVAFDRDLGERVDVKEGPSANSNEQKKVEKDGSDFDDTPNSLLNDIRSGRHCDIESSKRRRRNTEVDRLALVKRKKTAEGLRFTEDGFHHLGLDETERAAEDAWAEEENTRAQAYQAEKERFLENERLKQREETEARNREAEARDVKVRFDKSRKQSRKPAIPMSSETEEGRDEEGSFQVDKRGSGQASLHLPGETEMPNAAPNAARLQSRDVSWTHADNAPPSLPPINEQKPVIEPVEKDMDEHRCLPTQEGYSSSHQLPTQGKDSAMELNAVNHARGLEEAGQPSEPRQRIEDIQGNESSEQALSRTHHVDIERSIESDEEEDELEEVHREPFQRSRRHSMVVSISDSDHEVDTDAVEAIVGDDDDAKAIQAAGTYQSPDGGYKHSARSTTPGGSPLRRRTRSSKRLVRE